MRRSFCELVAQPNLGRSSQHFLPSMGLSTLFLTVLSKIVTLRKQGGLLVEYVKVQEARSASLAAIQWLGPESFGRQDGVPFRL